MLWNLHWLLITFRTSPKTLIQSANLCMICSLPATVLLVFYAVGTQFLTLHVSSKLYLWMNCSLFLGHLTTIFFPTHIETWAPTQISGLWTGSELFSGLCVFCLNWNGPRDALTQKKAGFPCNRLNAGSYFISKDEEWPNPLWRL